MITILFILSSLITYRFSRNIFHPAFLMISIWSIGFLSIYLIPSFYNPSLKSSIIIYSYLFVFIIVSILTQLSLGSINIKELKNNSIDSSFLNFISIFLFLGLILYVSRYLSVIFSFSSITEYFYRVRYASIYTDEPLVKTGWLLTQFKTYSIIITPIYLYNVLVRKFNFVKLSFCVSFIFLTLFSNIIEGARNEFVILSLIYISVFMVIKGFKITFYISIIFLILLMFLTFFTRGLNFDMNLFTNFFMHIIMYMFGSIISFDSFINNNIEVVSSIVGKIQRYYNYLSYNFHFIKSIDSSSTKEIEFTQISNDLRTNVYSFLSVRIHYFGFAGAYLSIFIQSFIVTILYSLRKNNLFLIFYIFMIPSIILSVFHDYFMAMIPYFYRLIFLLIILYYIKPTKYIKRFFINN